MEQLLLGVSNLSVRYGSIEAIRRMSLEIYESEMVAILGANGAGKTTFISAVSGGLPSCEGSTISFLGSRVEMLSCERRVKMGIVHVPEGRGIFNRLTVGENLELGAVARGDGEKWREELTICFEHFPVLRERWGQLAGTLSGGEQQMLAIARGIIAKPRLLLLDEPSLGLAPLLVRQILTIIKNINSERTTICLAEQNAVGALSISSRAYVFEQGEIALSGQSEELAKDRHVQTVYLGGKATNEDLWNDAS